jgi:hypothetical protein
MLSAMGDLAGLAGAVGNGGVGEVELGHGHPRINAEGKASPGVLQGKTSKDNGLIYLSPLLT